MEQRQKDGLPDEEATLSNEEATASDEEATEDDKYGKYVEFLLDLLSFF